jgi:hypothetical protein
MKRTLFLLLFPLTFLPSVFLNSCSKDDSKIDPDNLLLGTWNYSTYLEDAAVFTRSDAFTDNHCYRFKSDGTLTERKNSGWCGTPPVSYADYNGTWTIINDTLINVNVGYWGGNTSYKLDIEKIDESALVIRQVQPE